MSINLTYFLFYKKNIRSMKLRVAKINDEVLMHNTIMPENYVMIISGLYNIQCSNVLYK